MGVIVEEAVGLGEGDVVEKGKVAFGGSPIAVGGFVLRHDHERLFGSYGFFNLVESDGGDDVVAVAGVSLHLAIHLLEVGVVIGALAGKNFPMVEANRIGAEVPLTNHGGAVASLLHEDGEGLLIAVELGAVVEEAIEVGVFASEDAGTGGTTNGVGAKTVFK